MPLASESEHRPNFPRTVRKLTYPSRKTSAALVCGIPLPRAFGKYRYQDATPCRSARWIQARSKIFRENDECDYDEADNRADDQGEYEKDLVLILMCLEWLVQACCCRHAGCWPDAFLP